MALIPCPECGRMVSPNAENCPNCGAPVKELMSQYSRGKNAPQQTNVAPVKKQRYGFVWLAIAVVAVAAVVYFLFLQDKTDTPTHSGLVVTSLDDSHYKADYAQNQFEANPTVENVEEELTAESVEVEYAAIEESYEIIEEDYYDFFSNGDDFDNACVSQDAQVSEFFFYMDEDNRLSDYFEIINLRPDDTITYVEFTICFFSSRSNPKRYDIVPLYYTMDGKRIPGDKAHFGAICKAPYGEKVKINRIKWKDCDWYTKSDDVIGTRILEAGVRFKNGNGGHIVKLKGYPKNSRVRKGDEHLPFIM